jgi:hypothetical protein
MSTFTFLVVALAILAALAFLATLSAAHTIPDDSVRAATLSGTNDKETNEIEKKLVRNLRHIHSNEGACKRSWYAI